MKLCIAYNDRASEGVAFANKPDALAAISGRFRREWSTLAEAFHNCYDEGGNRLIEIEIDALADAAT